MKLRQSTLLKYVLSYLLILAVCFSGFYAVMRFHLQKQYASAYQIETEKKIENLSQILVQRFSDILTTNYIIESDTTYITARYSQSSYQRYLAVTELKKLATTNALIQDILYLDIQNGDALAANSTCFYKNGSFYIKTASGDVEIPSAFLDEKKYHNSLQTIPYANGSFCIFLCPRNSQLYRTVFVINQSQLNTLINTYTAQEIESVELLFDRTCVFSTTDAIWETEQLAQQPVGMFVDLNNEEQLYIQPIGTLKMEAAVRINSAFFSDSVAAVFEKSYMIMSLLLLIGVVMVYFALKSTYAPLHALRKRVTKNASMIENDIQALGRAFDASADEREALEAQITSYKTMIQRSLPLSATGDRDRNAQIDTLFSAQFYGSLAVALLRFSDDRLPLLSQTNEWTLVLLDETASGQSVLVICTESESIAAEKAPLFFSNLAARCSCTIAYSDFSSNPLDIARLLDMATQTQRWMTEQSVLAYSDIPQPHTQSASLSYPYQIFDEFAASLRQLDFDATEQQVQALFDLIGEEACPPIVARCVMMDILTSLNAAMSANAIKYDQYRKLLTQALSDCRAQNFSAVRTEAFEDIQALLTILKRETESVGLQLPQVLHFVDENCYQPEFTLAYLADYFGVTSVYMSTFFTKRMRVNLSDYIWERRLQRSKYLLETTELTIDQIAVAVGYEIVSSFRRKFKQDVGVSPSEYRRQYTAQE